MIFRLCQRGAMQRACDVREVLQEIVSLAEQHAGGLRKPFGLWLKGLAVLEAAQADGVREKSGWNEDQSSEVPEQLKPYEPDDVPWLFSKSFSDEIMLAGYSGQILFDEQSGTVFFNVRSS